MRAIVSWMALGMLWVAQGTTSGQERARPRAQLGNACRGGEHVADRILSPVQTRKGLGSTSDLSIAAGTPGQG